MHNDTRPLSIVPSFHDMEVMDGRVALWPKGVKDGFPDIVNIATERMRLSPQCLPPLP